MVGNLEELPMLMGIAFAGWFATGARDCAQVDVGASNATSNPRHKRLFEKLRFLPRYTLLARSQSELRWIVALNSASGERLCGYRPARYNAGVLEEKGQRTNKQKTRNIQHT